MAARLLASRGPAWRGVAWLLLILGVLVMLTALQRQLIYFPTVQAEAELLAVAQQTGLQPWRDGQRRVIGWHAATRGEGGRRLLVFHGNAGQALHRDYYLQGFHGLEEDWDVLLFEYPGYGAREGAPSEASLKAAAVAALETLLSQDARPVYLLGESLGSGVASHLAANYPEQVAGLLLVTPFTSLVDVAAHHYSFLPVRALLQERYDSLEALSHYRGPVAFLLAGDDEVVPTALGQRLHDSYPGPRWLRVEPGAGHNSLPMQPQASWWAEVSNFLLGSH